MNGWSISWDILVGITSKSHNHIPAAWEHWGDFRAAALKMGISHKEVFPARGVTQNIFVFVFVLDIKWIFLSISSLFLTVLFSAWCMARSAATLGKLVDFCRSPGYIYSYTSCIQSVETEIQLWVLIIYWAQILFCGQMSCKHVLNPYNLISVKLKLMSADTPVVNIALFDIIVLLLAPSYYLWILDGDLKPDLLQLILTNLQQQYLPLESYRIYSCK